jgi:hypothetical protein
MDLPPALSAFLREIGVYRAPVHTPVTYPPAWVPAYRGEEPPW